MSASCFRDFSWGYRPAVFRGVAVGTHLVDELIVVRHLKRLDSIPPLLTSVEGIAGGPLHPLCVRAEFFFGGGGISTCYRDTEGFVRACVYLAVKILPVGFGTAQQQ